MTAKPLPSNARLLDQFYTISAKVPPLVALVNAQLKSHPTPNPIQWLEPSAGSGSFLDHMPPNSLGLDVDPARADITKADFLIWAPPQTATSWIVVGNPPFGKNSSLAVKFFNHAAKFAHLIAFIVPRTFEKESIQNRLDPNFHLVCEQDLDPNSFVFEGQPISVPCVFQIWEKSATKRSRASSPKHHADFSRVQDPSLADFAFQRVGVKAGAVKDMTAKSIAAPSHHFIRVTNRSHIKQVRKRFEKIDFSSVKQKTAGNPSISLSELVRLYSQS